MKKLDVKIKHYLIIILIIFVIVFSVTGFSNIFGSNTDWINQHTIIPEYFRQLFYQNKNLFPNLALNYGGGQNIFNLSYYGLFNPIIMLSYLFPFIDMKSYLIITNIIIIIASSMLFYNFLKKHGYDDNITFIVTILFTLASPFIFHMHRHIMFVNYMPFLIMGLFGVDDLIDKNKKHLLILSTFLMVMTSYYYSIGGLIVLGIYYIYAYIKKQEEFSFKIFLVSVLKFIMYALIGVLMSSILIIPTAYTLFGGRSTSHDNLNLLKLFIPYFRLDKIFEGTYTIGLSVIGFIALAYLFSKKNKSNITAASLISLVLFIPLFCFILNGGLYLRRKCFIPFLPLIAYFVAYFLDDVVNKKTDIKKFSVIIIILGLCFLICMPSKNYYYIFVVIAGIILFLYSEKRKPQIIYLPLLISSFLICFFSNFYEEKISFKEYKSIFNEKTEVTIKNILNKDKGFYRTNNLDNPTATVNKIYDSNYYTTNIYSSTYNGEYLDFVRNTFPSSSIDYNYFLLSANKNILFNSFMGVKYLYSSKDLGLGYDKIDDNLYENKLSLPIIYGTDKIISNINFDNLTYPFNIDTLLHNAVVSEDNDNSYESKVKKVTLPYDVIAKDGVSISKKDDTYVLNVKEEGKIKVRLKEMLDNKILFINLYGMQENKCKPDNIKMTINGDSNILTCKTWPYKNRNKIFHFIINNKIISDIEIELTKGTYEISKYETFLLDFDTLNNIKEDKSELKIDYIKSDSIVGNISLENDGYLITSIPYDDGFKIFIDGKLASKERVNISFLGTKLEKGEHKVEIVYKSKGLLLGKILSCLGGIIFIIICINERKNNGKN